MSNETETAPTPQTDEELSWSQLDGSNGRPADDGVAEQYRSVQQAQLSHEHSIEELRAEVRDYGEQLASLSSSGNSNSGMPMEAVKLRLDALESKIGESAPDPLLNEIVHRLAALESSAGPRAKDPRVKEIAAEVEKLRKRAANPAPPDPRTDDLVLRIASLESGIKRSQDSSGEAKRLLERVEALESESKHAHEQRFEELAGQIQQIRESLDQQAGELPAPEVLSRLSGVESALEGCVTGSSFEQLSAKVQGLEESPESEDSEARTRLEALESSAATQEALESLSHKLEALERKPESEPGWARAEEVSAQFADLKEQLDGQADQASVSRLEERLGEIESASSKNDWMPAEEAQAQLAELKEQLASQPDQSSVSVLETRLAQIEAANSGSDWMLAEEARAQFAELKEQLASQPDQSPVSELETRLAQLEAANSGSDWLPAEEVRNSLADLEAKIDSASQDASHPKAWGDIEARLDVLESSGAEGSSAEHPRLLELSDRVHGLEERLESASVSSGDPEVSARLTDLGQQVTALLNSQSSGEPSIDPRAVAELQERLAELERRPSSEASSHDDSELQERLNQLESAQTSVVEPKLQGLTDRLKELEASTPSDGDDDTWGQLARNTLAEVGELRQELEDLRQSDSDSAGGSFDEGSLVQLGKGISESMNKAETRSLRAQMYFVYFTLGMLWMVVLYFVMQLRGGAG